MKNKDLQYFKDKVAKEQGFSDWFYLGEHQVHSGKKGDETFLNEAVERYANYTAEQTTFKDLCDIIDYLRNDKQPCTTLLKLQEKYKEEVISTENIVNEYLCTKK